MVKGWTPISVTNDLATDLESIWKEDNKKPRNQKFSPWLNNILLEYVEYHEQLKEYGPFLEYNGTSENTVHLYDHRVHKSIDVHINGKKKKLECMADETDCCVHIGFCFAIPEVYKVLIDAGFKEPKS